MWVVAVILAAILSVTCVTQAQELVGKVVPPFPGGMYEGGGACIGKDPQFSCQRGVNVLVSADGKKVGIFAASRAGRDSKGGALWTVSDVVAYPKVPKGHDLVWATCRNDRVEDTSIVAVVRNSKQPWLQAVGWAYRADEASGKFTKVDPKRVDCVNTALDAD
jgi:hypothetical protein